MRIEVQTIKPELTAAELDVAEGTVKASFHRANRKLAKKLEPLRELWERNEI